MRYFEGNRTDKFIVGMPRFTSQKIYKSRGEKANRVNESKLILLSKLIK